MIPIILAGGAGTRFWPLSRRDEPKQLLSLLGEGQTMIQATVERLLPLAPDGVPVRIVCRENLVDASQKALKNPASVEFIVEPAARNTAPAIALATATSEHHHGDAPVAFFPADHFVAGQHGFIACLQLAAERAAAQQAIITLGIPPTRPETGYGYIRCEAPFTLSGDVPTSFPVDAFVEKPDRRRALAYLQEGRYLWNSGIFVFRPSTLWAELERQSPQTWTEAQALRRAVQSQDLAAIDDAFRQMQSISIDYAVMEGAKNVEVIPALFRWSDVGHWASLDEPLTADEDENLIEADALLQDSRRCVVVSRDSNRLIAGLGLENLVIVDTADALLILPRDRAQEVRQIVDLLEEMGRTDLL